MIIIEAIINSIKAIFKPVIKGLVWIITARDCNHCKHCYRTICYWDKCDKNNNKKCIDTDCYKSITRKDFERKCYIKEG